MQGLRNCFGVFARSICKCFFQSFSHFCSCPLHFDEAWSIPERPFAYMYSLASESFDICFRLFRKRKPDGHANILSNSSFQTSLRASFAGWHLQTDSRQSRKSRQAWPGNSEQSAACPTALRCVSVTRCCPRRTCALVAQTDTHTCAHEYMYVHTYIHDIQISDYSLLSCSNCVSLPVSTTNNEIKGFGHTLAFL